jgi:hypothetical protein
MGTLAAKIGLNRRMNTAGNLNNLFIADVDDFTTIETPDITTNVDNNIIEDDHAFAAGKGFSTLEATYNSITDESTGSEEPDTTGERAIINAFLPGEEADLQEQVLNLKRGRFIILKQHRDSADTCVQYGSSLHEYAVLQSYKFTSGDFLGRKGFELVFKAEVKTKYFYKGAVSLKP